MARQNAKVINGVLYMTASAMAAEYGVSRQYIYKISDQGKIDSMYVEVPVGVLLRMFSSSDAIKHFNI